MSRHLKGVSAFPFLWMFRLIKPKSRAITDRLGFPSSIFSGKADFFRKDDRFGQE